MYSAVYLAKLPDGATDPSKDGFFSEKAAWEYIHSWMCDNCRKIRNKYQELKNSGSEPPRFEGGDLDEYWNEYFERYGDEYPPCTFEWLVGPTERVKQASSFDELLNSCGWACITPDDIDGKKI